MIEETASSKNRRSGKTGSRRYLLLAIICFVLVVCISSAFYAACGIVIIRPVTGTESGATIVYWRFNSRMPFLCSIDSLLVEKTGDYTIFERGLLLSYMAKPLQKRCLVRFGFSKYLYLLSTGGKDYKNEYF